MPDDLITVEEAAQRSGYNPEYIRRLARTGKIKAKKFGVVWQVSLESLMEYLRSAENHSDGRYRPKKH